MILSVEATVVCAPHSSAHPCLSRLMMLQVHRWVLTQGPDGHVVLAQAVRLDVPIIVPAAAAATAALMERRQRYKRISYRVTRVRELQHLHAPQIVGQELAERNGRPLHEEL